MRVKLGEICEINPKSIGISDDLRVSFIPMQSVSENGDIDCSDIRTYGEVKKGYTVFKERDVLFAKITPCMENGKGAVAADLHNGIGVGSTEFHVLRPDSTLVLSEWLYYLLSRENFRKECAMNMTGSAGQKRVPSKYLEQYEVELCSVEEQKDIVHTLDTLTSLIDKRKHQLSLLDELVRSRFVEMFGLPVSNSKKWDTEKMNEIAPAVNYSGNFEETVWLLNLDMVEAQTGRIIDYLYVSEEEVGNSTCTFDTSNVLYSKLRPYLNKVVIPDRCGYATSEMIPLKPNPSKLERTYLAFMLRSDEFVNMINEKVAGAKMPRVSMGDFRGFDVPVPPIELQKQFATFVEQTDKSKSAVQKAVDELETLKKKLMQEYFG